jgi:hypothetical protein
MGYNPTMSAGMKGAIALLPSLVFLFHLFEGSENG